MSAAPTPAPATLLTARGAARPEPPRGTGPWRDAAARLARNRFALTGGMVLIIVMVAAIAAPVVAPYDPNAQDYANVMQGPSWTHPFGTDDFGRDVFSRIVYGARISLSVGLLGTVFGLLVGLLIGLPAGYYGGWIDNLAMRVLDVQLAFPGLLLSIAVIAVLGNGVGNLIIAVGVFSIPVFARIVRGSILELKEQDFVTASRAVGASDRRLMFNHMMPNAVAPVLVISTLRIGSSILSAASLSFLGLGVNPPSPEWGAMLSDGQKFLQIAPHVSIYPGLAILLAVLAFNIFGDGLRDALDPRLRTAR